MADSTSLGYEGEALVFLAVIAIVAALYYWTEVSHVMLFWAAFILIRPLGATVGDFLDQPYSHGGLALSRPLASAVLAYLSSAACYSYRRKRRPIPRGANRDVRTVFIPATYPVRRCLLGNRTGVPHARGEATVLDTGTSEPRVFGIADRIVLTRVMDARCALSIDTHAKSTR